MFGLGGSTPSWGLTDIMVTGAIEGPKVSEGRDVWSHDILWSGHEDFLEEELF